MITNLLERIAFAVAVGLVGVLIGAGIVVSYLQPRIEGDAACLEQCAMWREAAEVCLDEMARAEAP